MADETTEQVISIVAAASTVAVLPHSGNVEASAEPDTEREEETDESVTTDAGEI